MSENASYEENMRIAHDSANSLNDLKKFNPDSNPTSALAEDSGVTDSNIGSFVGAAVQSGRGGMSGGGTNDYTVPPEEGGSETTRTRSSEFEGEGTADDRLRAQAEQAPGSVNLSGNQREPVIASDPQGERERNLRPLQEVGTGLDGPGETETDKLGNEQF